MHRIHVVYMRLVMIPLLFHVHDAALYSDRSNPSPWSLSVKQPPEIKFMDWWSH